MSAKTPIRVLPAIVLAVVSAIGSTVAVAAEFENQEGWAWIVPPFKWQEESIGNGAGRVILVEEGKRGELVVVFAHPGLSRQPVDGYYQFKPVAFDKTGRRLDLMPKMSSGTLVPDTKQWIFLDRWSYRSESVPVTDITDVGIEGMRIEGLRLQVDQAARSAAERGLTVLPFPVVGQPYDFRRTDLNDKAVDSAALRGKVVLIDFWASWCPPCMAKMPALKRLYDKWHGSGLEIVGVNFDKDSIACRKEIERLGLPWRQSMAPLDQGDRKLWMQAMGLSSLPRLLLIDRDGILRVDCDPEDLEESIDALMNRDVPERK